MTRIFFVCHPETTSHIHGRGLLTSNGVLQAKSLMPRLKAELFASVYVSPFPYTKQTASILTAGKSLILQNHVLVRELDYGALSKMIDHFVQSDLEVITKWWKYQDPGMVFPGGESLDSLRRRVRNFISQMVDRHALENILVISHRSTVAMVSLLANDLANEHFFSSENWPKEGSINLLTITPAGHTSGFELSI